MTRTLPDHIRRASLADAALGVDAYAPLDWLAGAAPRTDALTAWADGKLVDVPLGVAFDAVRLPLTPGWPTITYLRQMAAAVGPVLHTVAGVEVLVPVGSADGWDLPDCQVRGAGETARFPHPAVVAPHTRNGCTWIAAPRDELVLTDASDLYGAYAAALTSVRGVVLGGAA